MIRATLSLALSSSADALTIYKKSLSGVQREVVLLMRIFAGSEWTRSLGEPGQTSRKEKSNFHLKPKMQTPKFT